MLEPPDGRVDRDRVELDAELVLRAVGRERAIVVQEERVVAVERDRPLPALGLEGKGLGRPRSVADAVRADPERGRSDLIGRNDPVRQCHRGSEKVW